MSCKLSIITPVFNGVRFIEFCIRNVIEQNCPHVEHIIIDGGSTDGTAEIIQRYGERYPHIRFLSEKDRGQSDAMNKGVGMASGEILGFLNVDDYYEPGTLNDVVALFENLPEPTLLVGNCNVWDDDGALVHVNKPARIGLLLLLMQYIQAFPANPSAYFYHASLHSRIGLFDPDDHYAMDVHFIFKALRTAKVTYVDKLWGNYRYLTGTKTYNDVTSGQNSIRVLQIIRRYRDEAPLHYRFISRFVVTLVKFYQFCLKK